MRSAKSRGCKNLPKLDAGIRYFSAMPRQLESLLPFSLLFHLKVWLKACSCRLCYSRIVYFRFHSAHFHRIASHKPDTLLASSFRTMYTICHSDLLWLVSTTFPLFKECILSYTHDETDHIQDETEEKRMTIFLFFSRAFPSQTSKKRKMWLPFGRFESSRA